MDMDTIPSALLSRAASIMFNEAYYGPAESSGSWFVDSEPDSGIVGLIDCVSAATASQTLPGGASVVAHVGHLRYALSLANRALKGENPYPGADWKGSWAVRTADEAAWAELRAALRAECEAFKAAIADPQIWRTEIMVPGVWSQICHGAWHLGALRQALGMIEV